MFSNEHDFLMMNVSLLTRWIFSFLSSLDKADIFLYSRHRYIMILVISIRVARKGRTEPGLISVHCKLSSWSLGVELSDPIYITLWLLDVELSDPIYSTLWLLDVDLSDAIYSKLWLLDVELLFERPNSNSNSMFETVVMYSVELADKHLI